MDNGQLRAGWQRKTINEIAIVKGGKRVPKGYKFESIPTQHPYITVSDFTDDGAVDTSRLKYISNEVFEQIKSYIISSDDLYISIAGTIGKTGYVSAELNGANLTENACKLILNNGVSKEFVYYFTKSNSFIEQTGINTRVAAQPKLALNRLKTISIPLPPLPEQKRIVAILDEAFAGISLAVANAEKNLANARELFESYLNNVFTQKGDGWKDNRLGDLTVIQSGGTPLKSKSDYWDEGDIAWFSSGELNNMETITPKSKITPEGLNNSNAKLFPKGSLLIGMYDTAALKMSILDRDAAFNQAISGLKPNDGLDLRFVLHAINAIKPEVLKLRRGVRQKNLNLQKIKDIVISVPEFSEQQFVVKKLLVMEKDVSRLETIYQQKLTALNELKQSILQKAFTGELTQREENV